MSDHQVNALVSEVRDHVRLASQVSRTTALDLQVSRRQGRCPQCREDQLVVNPSSDLSHCFGCGAGGDVIRWVMLVEKLLFSQAVARLAADCGLVS